MAQKNDETKTTPAVATPAPAGAASTATTKSALPPTTPEQGTILARIARAIDRAISADPKRIGWQLNAFMLLEACGGQDLIAGKKDIQILTDLQRQHEHLSSVINSHLPDDAIKAWESYQGVLAKAIHSNSIEEHKALTPDQWKLEFEQIRETAKRDQARIYKECLPLCQFIGERFITIATHYTDRHEKNELARYEYFGVSYPGPSAIIVTFRKAIEIAKKRIEVVEHANFSPRELVPYLTF